MIKLIYTLKALLPDILSESEYLPVYAVFQLNIALFDKKTSQKQVQTALQNSKTHASSMVTQMPHCPTHRGLHPYGSTSANTLSVVALRHYVSNSGQITINKKIKTIYVRRCFTNLDNMCSFGSSFMMRVSS